MSVKHNANEIVFALREHGEDMERAMGDELKVVAGLAANTMKRLAAKGRTSGLAGSIRQEQTEPFAWEIKPNMDYAARVEYGVKPGGKGLPNYLSPDARDIIRHLQTFVPAGNGTTKRPAIARKGSKAFNAAADALRGRYYGLARHIRNEGLTARPFVEPTAKEMEGQMLSRLDLAVRRVLAARPDTGGATA
jgi:hypothetical protein